MRLLLALMSLALPAAAQINFEVREISIPPGLITPRTTQVAEGASHRVRDFPVVAGSHRFGFWTFNGVRQSFPNGQAFIYPEAVVTEAIEAVAHYFPEAQDGDGDRLADWWEFWMFGTRDRGPQDDDDGDGVRHEEEFQSGYSAAFRDGIPVGGISSRLSAPLRLIQRNRLTYSLRSAPLGLITADGELAPGQSYTTPHLAGDIAGYTFVGFEVDGVPKRDVTGYYLNQITVTPRANTRIVARYVPSGVDSDGDQIIDAVEFQNFGGLQYNRDDNPDHDDLTIGDEISQGLSLITADSLVDGGISARLSARLNYDRVRLPYVVESRPLGLLTRVSEMVNNGTARTSPHFGTDAVAGFVFGYWSVNGVRIAAPDGLARRQIQVTVNEATTLVAHFFDPAADSDGDGLKDGWEWATFGNLAQAEGSDPDNDDLTIAQEQGQGLSAAHEDIRVNGGLSTRLSAPLNYETGTRKRLLVRSRPLGIAAASDQYLAAGTAVTSNRFDFNTLYSEHHFTHWTRNGERVMDATGHARAQVVLTLSEDTELVAHFTPPGEDRDVDGIPDYLELRLAANLGVIGPDEDLDGDGFTYNQERGMGYSHLLQDQLRDGDVSARLSAPATLQFTAPPLELTPAQLGAVRGAPAVSLVANLSISPTAPGRTYQLDLVLGEGDRDNDWFTLAGNELRLAAPLDADAPRFLNARVRATDDLGVQRFYQLVVQVLEVPQITLQPADVFAGPGEQVMFRVLATGSAPLHYQWQFNEVALPGETGSALRLSNINLSNGGSYRVVVSSRSGSETSVPALLTVIDPEAAPLLAWWPFDDATNPALALDAVAGLPGTVTGTYSAPGTGHTGKPGDRAMRFIPNQKVVADGSFGNVAAAKDRISIVFWQKLKSVRNSSAFWFTSPSSNSDFRGISAHVPWSDRNIYFDHAGCCANGVQRISGPLPAIDTSEWHHFAFIKNGQVKTVFVDGVLAVVGEATAPLPTDFTGLVIGGNSVGSNMDGWIDDFAIYDAALSAESIQLLAAGMPPDRVGLPAPPFITLHPVDVSAVRGETVTFLAAALGSAPLRYQWQFNEADLPGKTGNLLEVSNVTPANSGTYRAVVSNGGGSEVSNSALLTVEELVVDLATWASGFGLTGADLSGTANPANDGINNLLKFAFNLNPTRPDRRTLVPGTGTTGLPLITSGDAGTVRFEFIRRKNSGLTYSPRKSSSLTPDGWAPMSATPTITDIDDSWERVVIIEPVAGLSDGKMFVHVMVTQ